MITRIVIPQIFENMEEATIGVWLKNEGESVKVGDSLCELITEKTTFQLEAEGEGLLRQIVAPEKAVVPTGAIIGIIADADESLPDVQLENTLLQAKQKAAAAGKSDAPAGESGLTVPSLTVPALNVPPLNVPSVDVATVIAGSTVDASAGSSPAGGVMSSPAGSRIRATPAARRVAREMGLALEDVAGRFPGKVIGEDDVKAFANG
jgi:pyruvate dehydrogenase E2 component (dihydrolipoamide acetyltransferase)